VKWSNSTIRYGTVTRAVICDSARAGLGPKLSHIFIHKPYILSPTQSQEV